MRWRGLGAAAAKHQGAPGCTRARGVPNLHPTHHPFIIFVTLADRTDAYRGRKMPARSASPTSGARSPTKTANSGGGSVRCRGVVCVGGWGGGGGGRGCVDKNTAGRGCAPRSLENGGPLWCPQKRGGDTVPTSQGEAEAGSYVRWWGWQAARAATLLAGARPLDAREDGRVFFLFFSSFFSASRRRENGPARGGTHPAPWVIRSVRTAPFVRAYRLHPPWRGVWDLLAARAAGRTGERWAGKKASRKWGAGGGHKAASALRPSFGIHEGPVGTPPQALTSAQGGQ